MRTLLADPDGRAAGCLGGSPTGTPRPSAVALDVATGLLVVAPAAARRAAGRTL